MNPAVEEARRWLGYMEHQDASLLGVPAVNIGKGGYTIFSEIVREAGCFWNFQGEPWCMTFIFAVYIKAYGYEETVKILGRPWPGTRTVARRMRRHGRWREPDYIPSSGDLIFLAPDGQISHAGIVEAVKSGQIISIDGNTVDPQGQIPAERGGAVAHRERPIGDSWIAGYGEVSNWQKN